jgi:hypothetical protein
LLYRQALDNPRLEWIPNDGIAHVGLAELFYEWNDLPATLSHVSAGLALLDRHAQNALHLVEERVNGYILLARIHEVQANTEDAARALQKANDLQTLPFPKIGLQSVTWAIILQVKSWIAQGDPRALRQWVDSYQVSKDWQA